MEREPLGATGNQTRDLILQRFFKGFIFGCIALFLYLVILKDVQLILIDPNGIHWQHIILIASFCALLAWCLERIFHLLRLERKVHYRLAFWVASASPFISVLLISTYVAWKGGATPPLNLTSIQLGMSGLASLGGSFLGCMLATTISDGFWENNSPPPPQIESSVYQFHQERLGILSRVPFWKRAFDILLSLAGLFVSMPIWFLGIFLIWYEDPGPLFFVKNSVGMGGKNFHQLKLRTMIRGAEDQTGPVISQLDDKRILITGHFFRKTALDELPQLINIIRGEMSFVGPRPQRTVLVCQYLQGIPEYAERHRVLPGLAGLAQVAGDYYLTPRQKLRLDRLYIRYMSLGFDLKLLFLAFILTFWYRWQKGWNGRLPRRLIRFGG